MARDTATFVFASSLGPPLPPFMFLLLIFGFDFLFFIFLILYSYSFSLLFLILLFYSVGAWGVQTGGVFLEEGGGISASENTEWLSLERALLPSIVHTAYN